MGSQSFCSEKSSSAVVAQENVWHRFTMMGSSCSSDMDYLLITLFVAIIIFSMLKE
jgi:uncharacterized protein YqhQ